MLTMTKPAILLDRPDLQHAQMQSHNSDEMPLSTKLVFCAMAIPMFWLSVNLTIFLADVHREAACGVRCDYLFSFLKGMSLLCVFLSIYVAANALGFVPSKASLIGRTTGRNRKEPAAKSSYINQLIHSAYHRDSDKPAIQAIVRFSREGRKYGFNVNCSMQGKSENERVLAAAMTLLAIEPSWPFEDIPEDFRLTDGTTLHRHACQFVANATHLPAS